MSEGINNLLQNVFEELMKNRYAEEMVKAENWWCSNAAVNSFFEDIKINCDTDYINKSLKKIKKESPKLLHKTGAAKKSNSQSTAVREKANVLFKKKEWIEALKQYSQSIALAENGSTELGFAYANRSALLLHRGCYKECLEDIERALKLDYPSDKKPQLINRREKAMELAPTQEKGIIDEEIPPSPSKNQSLLGATEAIKLSQNDQYGRFIEATRDIAPGEIILIENPYVLVTSRDYKTTHCGHCNKLCFNLIPCGKCSIEMYCSETCKDIAFNEYHQYECIILKYYPSEVFETTSTPVYERETDCCDDQAQVSQLALRLTLKGFRNYQTSASVSSDDRYEEIEQLQTHKDDLSKAALMVLASNLAKQFHILTKHTNFMSTLNFQDKWNILNYHMLRNRLIVCFNLAIIQYKLDVDNVDAWTGVGLYPTYSMFNHACYPNVECGYIGHTMVVRALRTIKKGEQCFTNYGHFFQYYAKETREAYIKARHLFTCKCIACERDWPRIHMNPDTLTEEHSCLNVEVYLLFTNTTEMLRNQKILDEKTKQTIMKACGKYEKIIKKPRPTINFIIWYNLMKLLTLSKYQALNF